MHRRLPIYLLLDCSESMAGEPWKAVKTGLAKMIQELQSDPMALETAALSIITFSNSARQDIPLTDIPRLSLPRLKMGSGTALGAALRLWLDAMQREVKQTTAEQKGDYKPVTFVLTDGEPTDAWGPVADNVRQSVLGKKANVIAVGCGDDAALGELRRLTDTVIHLHAQTEVSFGDFFKWVSASVSTASLGVVTGGEQGIQLPGLEAGMELAPQGGGAPASDRQLFLHARCVRDQKFFLYRYLKQEKRGLLGGDRSTYECAACIPIDDAEFDFSQNAGEASVATSRLGDAQPCPYCSNPTWGMCEDGHVLCTPVISRQMTLTCPWCQVAGVYRPASFDVGRGAG